jgi:hypothetical protein
MNPSTLHNSSQYLRRLLTITARVWGIGPVTGLSRHNKFQG